MVRRSTAQGGRLVAPIEVSRIALAGVVGFASIAWYTSGKRKDWKMVVKAVLVGMAVTFVLMAIFGYLLQVPLPEGEIFD